MGEVVKETPILFNFLMVNAILNGRKTQTRRIVKRVPLEWLGEGFTPEFVADRANNLSPFGYVADRLWVRETWAWPGEEEVLYRADPGAQKFADLHKADPLYPRVIWRPSIHMPHWASRITLEITDVRIERVQEISEEDANAEGVDSRAAFVHLWDTIYSWDQNAWVWVYTFKRIK